MNASQRRIYKRMIHRIFERTAKLFEEAAQNNEVLTKTELLELASELREMIKDNP